jgi:secreted Zn-dependent insulinase-like peptidase
MSQQPELTPKQQALMNFLDQLATTPLTPEMLAHGNQLLDDAAEECRQQQEQIRSSARNFNPATRSLKPCQTLTEP